MMARYTYHKINGLEFENDLITLTALAILPNKKFHPVGGFIFETSQLYQLKYRYSPGAGIGVHLSKNKKQSILLHAFGSYDNTEFFNIPGYQTFRVNGIIWGSHEVVKNKLDLTYRLFYFQSIQDVSNYIFRAEPKLLFKLSKVLSMTLNLDYRFENIVDPMNTKENVFLSAGLQISGARK